jgi:hypothetical protein
MEDTWKILTGTLAGIFAVLFVITTPLAFALYSVEQSVFNAEFYTQALEEENMYQRLPELIADALASTAGNDDSNNPLTLLSNLSGEEWQQFMIALLPPDELRLLSEDTIVQLVAYLNGESDQVVFSLASLKAYLGSQEGVNAIYGMLKAQPDCTVEQLTAMAMGQQDLVLCNPPETFLLFDLRPIYEQEIRALVSVIPDQMTILTAGADRAREIQNLKSLRTIMRLSPFLPIFCLLLITVFVVRSLRDWLNWWGYPLLFAGLISMSLTALSGPLAAFGFQIFVVPVLSNRLPADFLNVFKDLFAAIVHNALQPTLLVAGVLALVGLIMVALTFLFGKRLRSSQRYQR